MSAEKLTAPMIRALLESLARRMYTTGGVVYQISAPSGTVTALVRRELVETDSREITLENGTPDHWATAHWLTEAGSKTLRQMLEHVISLPADERPEPYREHLTQPRRSEALAAFLLQDARRICTTDEDSTGNVSTGAINRADGREQLGSALRAGHRITFADTGAVTVHREGLRYTFAPVHQEQAPHDQEQAEEAAALVRRFHMRTVNGGTPERIDSAHAMREINAAMMGKGRARVKERSAWGRSASILYKDGRGKVELRPATPEESAAPEIPVSERYAKGDRVIVRRVSWDPHYRVHTVQPEFIGTVVRYARNDQYVVREPVHQTVCHYLVRELRPAPPSPEHPHPTGAAARS